jgi:hypothetical protein
VIVVMLATHFALGPVFVPAIVIMLTLEVADVAGVLLGEMIVFAAFFAFGSVIVFALWPAGAVVAVFVYCAAMPIDIHRPTHGESEGTSKGTALEVEQVGLMVEGAALLKRFALPNPADGAGHEEDELEGEDFGRFHG